MVADRVINVGGASLQQQHRKQHHHRHLWVSLLLIGSLVLMLTMPSSCSDKFINVFDKTPHRHHDVEIIEHANAPLIEKQKTLEIYESAKTTTTAAGNAADNHALLSALDNVVHYAGIQKIESVSIPIKLNLIFCGFDGDGNNAFVMDSKDMKPWFKHIEHELRHLVVPVGEHQVTTERVETPQTHIKYRISTRVVKLSPFVNTIIENTLLWGARPDMNYVSRENDHATSRVHYVDAFRFSTVLHHLLEYMGLNDSYTIFVLNPKKPIEGDDTFYGYRTGFSSHEINELYQKDILIESSSFDLKGRIKPNKPNPAKEILSTAHLKVSEVDMRTLSEKWAKWYIKEFSETNDYYWAEVEDEDDPSLLMKREEMQLPLLEFAEEVAINGTPQEKAYLKKVIAGEIPSENCLTDIWISHRRFAFIDVAAGPFEWGPILASEGVRTHSSIPRPPFSKAPSNSPAVDDDELDVDLLWEQQIESISSQLMDSCETKESMKTAYCQGLMQRMRSLEKRLDEVPDEMFSRQDLEGLEEEEGEGELPLEKDNFYSQMGALLSSALRHLITPPTPLFRTPYVDRVTFHLFVIAAHDLYDPLSPDNFDYDEFKHEISKFQLRRQEFAFTMTTIKMKDDPAISMAFYSSIHSVILPHLTIQGDYHVEEQLSLDSIELQSKLRPIYHQYDNNDEHKDQFSRHIPIFLFSLGKDQALLIDKYYTAKALSNMIIVVQSDHYQWQTRLFCGHSTIYWNLRNPLRSALSATALLLAGLVPSHISYNEAHQAAAQEWIWSVGDNPMSYTSSHGHHFSDFHRDIAHRNYIVQGLNDSITEINAALDSLSHQKITPAIAQSLSTLDLPALINLYNQTLEMWLEAVTASEGLLFDKATSKLKQIQKNTSKFVSLADEIAMKVNVIKCRKGVEEKAKQSTVMDNFLPVFFLLDALIIVTLFLLKRKKPKAKVN